MTINSKDTLLSLQHLQVAFNHFDQTKQSLEWKQVVHDVSFDIKKGEILALVGESGSGKSVSAMSTLNLFSPGSAQLKGTLEWKGKKISAKKATKLTKGAGYTPNRKMKNAIGIFLFCNSYTILRYIKAMSYPLPLRALIY